MTCGGSAAPRSRTARPSIRRRFLRSAPSAPDVFTTRGRSPGWFTTAKFADSKYSQRDTDKPALMCAAARRSTSNGTCRSYTLRSRVRCSRPTIPFILGMMVSTMPPGLANAAQAATAEVVSVKCSIRPMDKTTSKRSRICGGGWNMSPRWISLPKHRRRRASRGRAGSQVRTCRARPREISNTAQNREATSTVRSQVRSGGLVCPARAQARPQSGCAWQAWRGCGGSCRSDRRAAESLNRPMCGPNRTE